jgi:hypothetical protein
MGRHHRGHPRSGTAIRETPRYPGGAGWWVGLAPSADQLWAQAACSPLRGGQVMRHSPGGHFGPAANVQLGHHMMQVDLGGLL